MTADEGTEPRRNQKAHELTVAARRHVDADNGAVRRDSRTATHAGIKRPGEMDAIDVAALCGETGVAGEEQDASAGFGEGEGFLQG